MKIAVFGKPGGGKSTLSRKIAVAADLPLHQLDLVQYEKGGAKVPDQEFLRRHPDILVREHWVVAGERTYVVCARHILGGEDDGDARLRAHPL